MNPRIAHSMVAHFDLVPGSYVVLYLHEPKEKIWGVLVALTPAGVTVRGLDLAVFDDWMRQVARDDEALIGPTTLFYPMGRLERVEKDETIGVLTGYADRFAAEVHLTVREVLGLPPESPN